MRADVHRRSLPAALAAANQGPSNLSSEVLARFSKQLRSECLCIQPIEVAFENSDEMGAVFVVRFTLLSFASRLSVFPWRLKLRQNIRDFGWFLARKAKVCPRNNPRNKLN